MPEGIELGHPLLPVGDAIGASVGFPGLHGDLLPHTTLGQGVVKEGHRAVGMRHLLGPVRIGAPQMVHAGGAQIGAVREGHPGVGGAFFDDRVGVGLFGDLPIHPGGLLIEDLGGDHPGQMPQEVRIITRSRQGVGIALLGGLRHVLGGIFNVAIRRVTRQVPPAGGIGVGLPSPIRIGHLLELMTVIEGRSGGIVLIGGRPGIGSITLGFTQNHFKVAAAGTRFIGALKMILQIPHQGAGAFFMVALDLRAFPSRSLGLVTQPYPVLHRIHKGPLLVHVKPVVMIGGRCARPRILTFDRQFIIPMGGRRLFFKHPGQKRGPAGDPKPADLGEGVGMGIIKRHGHHISVGGLGDVDKPGRHPDLPDFVVDGVGDPLVFRGPQAPLVFEMRCTGNRGATGVPCELKIKRACRGRGFGVGRWRCRRPVRFPAGEFLMPQPE